MTVDGVETYVQRKGEGQPVVCIHGVPTSSFLYRKVLTALTERNLRGIAFDLPGLGLSSRPDFFDYSWTGLGSFSSRLTEKLELDSFHLVLHDIGGPIGYELIHRQPESIRSLTLLNTMIRVDEFSRPWPMEPFAHPCVGEAWLAGMVKPLFRLLMYRFGLENNNCMTVEELNTYVDLLKRDDGGKAFLKIMRGFEMTEDKGKTYESTIRNLDCPKRVIWGANDPALAMNPYAEKAQAIMGVDHIVVLEARHFLQEEKPDAIAQSIYQLIQ